MFEPDASLVVTALLWRLVLPEHRLDAPASVELSGYPGRHGEASGSDGEASTSGEGSGSDAALRELVRLQTRAARHAADEMRLLVRAAGAQRVVREVLVDEIPNGGAASLDARPRTVELVDEVVDEIAAALHRSNAQVWAQLGIARLLTGPLAATLADLDAGIISYSHARAIAEQARRLEFDPGDGAACGDAEFAEACERLQARVLPKAAHLTVAQTRALAARVVVSIDRDAAARRRRAARRDCNVMLRPLDDGLALLQAVLPAIDAVPIMNRIDECARAWVANGSSAAVESCERTAAGWSGVDPSDLLTLGQLRAAVLTGLVCSGNPTPVRAGNRRPGQLGNPGQGQPEGATRVELGVVIDAATLLGLDPTGPAWVSVGTGHVDVDRADLIELLARPDVHATMRRLVTDPTTGALVDRGANAYRVSESLKAWIRARDLTCTFPGCRRTARRCDVDHAVDFCDGGRTTIANTRALCRRHHNAKTHSGWRISDSRPDGSCTFVSPNGARYRHEPVPIPAAPVGGPIRIGDQAPEPGPPSHPPQLQPPPLPPPPQVLQFEPPPF